MPLLRNLMARSINATDSPWDTIFEPLEAATGKRVTPSDSLRVATVYAAVRLLAESVSSLPASLILREGNRRTTQDGPLSDLLTVQPNEEQDAPELWRTVMGWMLIEGDAYVYVERDRNGMPTALWPLPTTGVTVGRTPSRRLYYNVSLAGDDPDLGFNVARLGPESVLHYKAFGTGLYGLSPIRQVREAVATSLAAQEYMGRFYRQDASPGGVIQVPDELTDEQFNRLNKQWKESHQGVQRSHMMAILEAGATWQTVGLNPGDAAFIETQKWETVEIARAFGVPPHMIGDVERSTSWGSGIAEQGIGFVTYTLTPWITRLEWVARRGLLASVDRRLRYKVRVDGLQRGDTKSRYEGYAIGKQWGWLSTNDIRTLEDQDPVDGGDVYLQPLNMVEAGRSEPGTPGPDPDRGARQRQDIDVGGAVMVAIYPPEDVARELAVPDGLSPDDMHVTLAYLGRDLADETLVTASRVVASVAAQHQPLSGTVGGGLVQFPAGDEGTPVCAPVDVPGLAELRYRLVEQLEAAGVEVASDHGFTPHMTLTYMQEGEDPPGVPDAQSAPFPTLSLSRGGARTDYPLTGKRQRHIRSGASRRKIAERHASLIADADRAVAEYEQEQVDRLVQSHLVDRSRSPGTFMEAIEQLYDGDVRDNIIERWTPALSALATAIAVEAADEIGGDDPPDLARWVRAYVASHAGFEVGRSIAKLRTDTAAEDAAGAVRSRLEGWVADRPAVTARWESTQMSRSAARETWRTQGVRELVWTAGGGDTCDLCLVLDGKVVGIEQPFVNAGQKIPGGEGQADLEAQRNQFTPPLHPGCDCDITPG